MNWHALEGSREKHQITVVFHIPVPNINNIVGVSYRTAISKEEPFTASRVPYLAADFPAEVSSLQVGALYEHIETVNYNANLADAQKLALINARYTVLVGEIQTELQNKYIYWGKNQDVA
jgi:hypothetical protein